MARRNRSWGEAPSRTDGTDGYDAKIRRRRRSRVLATSVIAIIALLFVAGGFAFAYVSSINTRLTEGVDDTLRDTLSEPTRPDDPFYLLLLGVDKDQERTESSEYGADESNYRSDSIMLVRVDPQNVKVTMVSIHRDTYVDMGENGKGKINSAYSFGGPAYATEVISQFAGVPIAHYAEVDLDRFIAIVDQVGGVTIDLPIAIEDPYYTGISLEAGEQTLDGTTAALLARSRHAYDAYGDGDLYRAANQRMIISAVVKKVLASDPVTMTSTISAMADSVTTDMDISTILDLAGQMSELDTSTDVYAGMAPTTSKVIDGIYYEICDTEAWREMMMRVDQGLPPYEDGDEDSTAGIAGAVE